MRLPFGDKESLTGRASRALGLSFLNTVAGRFGTLAIGVLLARLLGPHAFGTYAVAFVALLAVLSFNELGVSLAIVRWPGEPREIAPTVTTISCMSSVVIYVGLFLAAPPFAAAMGAPAATPVIRVLAMSILIDGVAAVPAALLQRYFRQDRKLIADQANAWLGAAVSVGLAWAGFGAMALGIGQMAGALVSGILLVVFSPLPLRFGLDTATARALLKFGLPLAGSSLIVFLVANVDNFTVGHMLGATALGFYVLAWNLSSWPVNMFSQPVRNVAPALFSRLQHDRTAMHTGFVSGAGLLGSVTLPICLLFSGGAVPLIRFIYGPSWVPAAQALRWLALLAGLRIFFELSYDYFVVLARSRVVFTVQLAWLLVLIPSLIVGTRIDGIRGAAIAGAAVAACVVLPWYLRELNGVGIRPRALVAQLWFPLAGALGVGLFAVGAGGVIPGDFASLAVSGVVTLAAIGMLVYKMWPELTVMRSVLGSKGEPDHAPAPAGATRATSASVAVTERSMTATGDAVRPMAGSEGGRTAPTLAETISAIEVTMPLPVYHDSTGPLPIYREVAKIRGYEQFAAFTSQDGGGRDTERSHDSKAPVAGAPPRPGPDDPAKPVADSQALARDRDGARQ